MTMTAIVLGYLGALVVIALVYFVIRFILTKEKEV